MGRLNDAFEEKLVAPRDLAVHRAQSINDLGSGSDDIGVAAISASTDAMKTQYRVDYSDFSNFVFFNSALDYFNVSGERILNEFKYDGTLPEYLSFISASDGYQRWLFEQSWPSALGDNSGTAVWAKDPSSRFIAGTSSFSIELYGHMSRSGLSTIAERGNSGNPPWSIWMSASSGNFFRVGFTVSGSSGSATVSYDINYSSYHAPRYLSFICDRDSNQIKIVHAPNRDTFEGGVDVSGFIATYPATVKVLASASCAGIGTLSATSAPLSIGTGSSGSYTTPLTSFSYWTKARGVEEIKNSHAGNIYAQDDLTALYRFDNIVQTGSLFTTRNAAQDDLHLVGSGTYAIVVCSGTKGPHGLPISTLSSSRSPVPVLRFDDFLAASTVQSYVNARQLTATLYDKDNTNIITRMVPEAYLQLEQEVGTQALQDFLYIIAHQFDEIKVAIDQFVYWNKSNYTGFNDTPDALLKDAANYYGWDFVGNFLDHDAIKYFFGKGVVAGADLDMKLYEIKNQFWRRTLNELMHIYKTKGTRESVEALIRVYGLDSKLVKLKEYGTKPFGLIETKRVNSHKSIPAFHFVSGSSTIVSPITTRSLGDGFEIAMHMKFDEPTLAFTQQIFAINTDYSGSYSAVSGSDTGTLHIRRSGTNIVTGSVPIFDGNWWNIFFVLPSGTGNPKIVAKRLDGDTIAENYSFTGSIHTSSLPASGRLEMYSNITGGFYANEVKHYRNYILTDTERDAQTYDFQSYGLSDLGTLTSSLVLHWRLDEDFVITGGVAPSLFPIYDSSRAGAATGTLVDTVYPNNRQVFGRFLTDYNFIAPVEYGWNEEKIRTYEGSQIKIGDVFNDANALALEFNLVDALNEDISKMLATLDNWNNIIGVPVNKFRESYPDLQRYRNYYFEKLSGRVNFRQFADMLEFFDRSFIKMVQKLLPARAIFYGEEFVVESHMLERPKVQWAYRRYNPELVPEGIITMVDRTGSDNSTVVATLTYV